MPIGLGLTLPNSAAGGIYNRVLGVVEQLLLDAYPNAAAAYSTRLLNTAYTGAALVVRRAADNVEVDVPFGANTALGTADMEGFLRSYTGGFGTNLLLYSEEFDNAYWSKVGITATANSISSPAGSISADLILEQSAGGAHAVFRGDVAVTLSGRTLSWYVKPAGRNWVFAGDADAVSGVYFDVQNGVVGNSLGGATGSISGPFNGFYRVSVAASGNRPTVFLATGNGDSLSYAGDATKGVYLWGAQLELGSTATTYDYKRDTANTSAFVTTWYDQSGNGRNATQTTAANQPRIVNAGVVDAQNSRVALVFNGTSNSLKFSALSISDASIFASVENNGAATNRPFAAGSPANTDLRAVARFQANNVFSLTDSAKVLANSANNAVPVKLNSVSGLYTPTKTEGYVNGLLVASSTVVRGTPLTNNAIGTQNDADFFSGRLPEIILYPSDQSANRAAIESNIMSYYSIT